ncbi:MAG: carboxypeptidase-like regulatory domain-containing protein [Spirosomataceae bacterium]
MIQGVVKEQGTFQPIIGAVLVIIETGQVAVTDSAGRYKIQKLCQGKYKLECRIVGYKTTQTTVFLQHTTEENIHLNEEEVHLQDVEIIARRAPRSLPKSIRY